MPTIEFKGQNSDKMPDLKVAKSGQKRVKINKKCVKFEGQNSDKMPDLKVANVSKN